MKNQKGLSLIEILIVFSIIVLLVSVSILSYRSFERGTELETVSQEILATLKLAQTKTLASEGASPYGLHFETSRYILFKGDSYQTADPLNKTYPLATRLEIYDINLSDGGNDIIFKRLTGQSEQSGTVALRIVSEPSRTKTIAIDSSGKIEIAASLAECCQAGRLTDTRHIHLNLGWSIQGATTLTLYFPDTPEVITDVNMADYFNPLETEFNYLGIIDVNEEKQELRIHTHFLDATSTVLCIHRDKAKNNKPLQIFIDAKDIISYTAQGEATIGTFGGTGQIQ